VVEPFASLRGLEWRKTAIPGRSLRTRQGLLTVTALRRGQRRSAGFFWCRSQNERGKRWSHNRRDHGLEAIEDESDFRGEKKLLEEKDEVIKEKKGDRRENSGPDKGGKFITKGKGEKFRRKKIEILGEGV